MCQVLAPAGFDDWANLLILCEEDPVEHALTWLGLEGDNARSLLAGLARGTRCILMEQYYFDIDHRSEIELIQATQFAPADVTVDRIHFFSLEFTHGDSIHAYLADAHEKAAEADARKKAAEADPHKRDEEVESARIPIYLGYSILRSRRDARIGRSLISPWAAVKFRSPRDLKRRSVAHSFGYTDGEMIDPAVVYEQVRTAVPETVDIYGHGFRAVGVPFMEQDGYILRCAHVSAWICHYSAVLRGLISRRTTGQIHRAGYTTTSVARSYPSAGISSVELGATLREVQLAPETLGFSELSEPRAAQTWADRNDLFARNAKFLKLQDKPGTKGERANEDLQRLWLRENLTATVCRYLNSGLPIIIARNVDNHTQVVVGYLRASDLTKSEDKASEESHSDVTAFLVSDDQEGPFELVYVDEIIDELLEEELNNEVFIPLPDAVWLSGDTAEALGVSIVQRMADTRVALLDGSTEEGGAASDGLRKFAETLGSGVEAFTVRTYVTAGTDFKHSAATRMEGDISMVNAIRRLQLPRFVWVCEVIERSLRAKRNQPSVVATIVLDATQLIQAPAREVAHEDIEPLFAHLPRFFYAPSYQYETKGYPEPFLAQAQIYDFTATFDDVYELGATLDEDDLIDIFWHRTDIGPYFTGRWGHRLLEGLLPTNVGAFAKGAVAKN